jgi:TIR domain-containing protein
MSEKSRGKEQLEALRAGSQAPKIFISYSHDSSEHKNWVLNLASSLRENGIDAILDVWDLKIGDDVARFMEQHLASSDRVIIVCSEHYAQKAEEGKGGVGYETMLVTAEILQNRGVVKFIPILRNNPSKTLPQFLQTKMWIDFQRDADYTIKLEELIRVLHEKPLHPKPSLGKVPSLPEASPIVRDVFEDEWFLRHRSSAMAKVESRGGFMEISFGISSYIENRDHRILLNIAERSAIHTFGWPIGVVLHVDNGRPRPEADGIVAEIESQITANERYDYWALSLKGAFYEAHNLFENEREPSSIFFNTRIVRTAEALLYCRNLYNNMGVDDGALVRLRIRHSGIKGRTLSSSNPNRIMWPHENKSSADSSESTVEFQHPLTDHDVVEKTRELLNPLFVLFDYFELSESVYQDIVGNFIQGRCT